MKHASQRGLRGTRSHLCDFWEGKIHRPLQNGGWPGGGTTGGVQWSGPVTLSCRVLSPEAGRYTLVQTHRAAPSIPTLKSTSGGFTGGDTRTAPLWEADSGGGQGAREAPHTLLKSLRTRNCSKNSLLPEQSPRARAQMAAAAWASGVRWLCCHLLQAPARGRSTSAREDRPTLLAP